MNSSQPKARIFSPMFTVSHGARNCPFLIFTGRPLLAQASRRSVWRHKKAGTWSRSTYSAAISASWAVCTSVTTGSFSSLPISDRMRQPFPHAGTAKRGDGSAVRLVVGSFENQRDIQVFRDGLDGAGHLPYKGFAFQRAGAQKVERPRAADFNGLNVKRHKTKPVCPCIMTVSGLSVKPLPWLRADSEAKVYFPEVSFYIRYNDFVINMVNIF